MQATVDGRGQGYVCENKVLTTTSFSKDTGCQVIENILGGCQLIVVNTQDPMPLSQKKSSLTT